MSLSLTSFVPASPAGVSGGAGFGAAGGAATGQGNPAAGFAAFLNGVGAVLDLAGPLIPGQPVVRAAVGLLAGAATVASNAAEAASETDPALEASIAAPPDVEGEPDLDVLVARLADLLASADTALANGESVDPELATRLAEVVAALESRLGAPEGTSPATPAADGEEQPLLSRFLSRAVEIDAKLAEAGQPVARLQNIVSALAAQQSSEELLGKLGLLGDEPADGTVKRALEALLAPKGDAKAPPPQNPFLAAGLKLPDSPALTATTKSDTPTPISIPGAEGDDTDAAKPLRIDPIDPRAPRAAQAATGTPDGLPSPTARTADAPAPPPVPASAPALPASQPAAATVAAVPRPAAIPYHAPQVALPQVAFEIVRQIQNGVSRFQIRLDPPELGRIDVRMDMDAAGNTSARLTVERAETLDMFQRDQRALERALAQAGLDSAKTTLEFSLKQNGSEQGPGSWRDERAAFGTPDPAADPGAGALPVISLYRGAASAAGIDMTV